MAGSTAYTTEDGKPLSSGIWGGESFTISQGFGEHLGGGYDAMYAYSASYGLNAGDHAGIDIAMPVGTQLYAPVDGEIIAAGGVGAPDLGTADGGAPFFSPYPVYEKTTDGRVIIFGHGSKDQVTVGQKVKKGDPIMLSGQETVRGHPDQPDGSGAHLHLEERVPGAGADGIGVTGYTVVDPMDLIIGSTGSGNAASSSGGGFFGSIKLPSVFGTWGPIGSLLVLSGAVVATVATIHLAGGLGS